MSEASTSYKKQDGKLLVSRDGRTVSWKPNAPSTSPLTIAVSEITNLQQTPEKSAKVSIKIVVQRPSASGAENHTFAFTSATAARAEQVAITSLLRKSIEAARAQNGSTPVPAADDGGGPSAAMAIAQAVSAGARAEDNMFDDGRLMSNTDLQKSLLNANPALRQRFDQALREKPDTITISQFSAQFWAARVHLLRAHAVEKSQSQGTYNVLSEVKPKNVDGTTRLNLSKEQIQLIFNQHPLVKKVYNENVPQLSEMEFWSRFFVSRLFKKLKGEKITETDSTDPKLDRYLNFEEEAERTRQLVMAHVPHFIDLEGNEQNHSQRQGNRPDWTMQPNTNERVPILRVLNSMSEKMLADVTPTDADPHAPSGIDEETYKELQLRDLQRGASDNRIMLKIKDQGQFFSGEQDARGSSSASLYAKRTPDQVLSTIQKDFKTISTNDKHAGGLNLESTIGVQEDSDSEEDERSKTKTRVGSKFTRTAATAQIMGAIRQRHLHTDDYLSSSSISSADQAAKLGLGPTVFESLVMTHNTTVEFLHYFWTVFLSGDPDRAGEAQKLVETLDKSLDRISAVAKTAENERMQKIEKSKKQVDDYMQRTGKRRKFDPNSIKGGARAVTDMMTPLVLAIKTATEKYRRAYELQMAQIAQLQNMV
ncbi:RNA polymerase II transcription factor-like protein [Lepidopterella palustris CBS 459.81]|uniref:RNA polymerase II transcription factor-like protein n=1 Tax=Lepidopterella palustris CBS 459.81 TaxID=1314670 RepID=A0A8E2JIZ0_9PEZI|nr:RNA polymerase II transcription factor-like protein [Lepidopterella palustris CBS 459.81]